MKTSSLCYWRNPNNANAQKHKKAQSELNNKQNTSKTRSIKLETRLKIGNLGYHGRL